MFRKLISSKSIHQAGIQNNQFAKFMFSSMALTAFLQYQQRLQQQNECCGIVGYIGNQRQAGDVCSNGLTILQSRGYDSCGIVSIDSETKKFKLNKFASTDRFGGDCIKRLQLESKGKHDEFLAIGHTRWATHGDKTDVNAHPHFDHKERVALVHNGIISNYFQLRKELKEKYGLEQKTQTDTEIVAMFIGVFLDKGQTVFEAISNTVRVLEGAYSFLLISILDPEAMYIVKNTGTMVIGFPESMAGGNQQDMKSLSEAGSDNVSSNGDAQIDSKSQEDHKFQIVTSDTTVFQDFTKVYYNIEDKEILRLSLHDKVEHRNVKKIAEEGIKVTLPPGIEHFYLMEMLEQPEAVCRSLNYGARLMGGENMVKLGGLDSKRDKLIEIDNLIIAACGTSNCAGAYGQYLMRDLGCFKYVESVIASEIQERDLPKKNAGFLSISQSGETMDLLIPFRLAKKHNLQRINVVNKVNSTLARENDCGVFMNCGREFSVASTKAYVCQVTTLVLVALWFAQNKNFNATKKKRSRIVNELKMLSSNMKKTLETTNEKSPEIAPQLLKAKHVFFCGVGIAEYVAKEGALKMKELTYLHCQSIDLQTIGNNFFNYLVKYPRSPAIFIVLDSQKNKESYITKMEQLQAKTDIMGIVITDITDHTLLERLKKFSQDRTMKVQKSGPYLSALLCVIPLQRLAYDLTLCLGYHPDKPRNLAKELTTQ